MGWGSLGLQTSQLLLLPGPRDKAERAGIACLGEEEALGTLYVLGGFLNVSVSIYISISVEGMKKQVVVCLHCSFFCDCGVV